MTPGLTLVTLYSSGVGIDKEYVPSKGIRSLFLERTVNTTIIKQRERVLFISNNPRATPWVEAVVGQQRALASEFPVEPWENFRHYPLRGNPRNPQYRPTRRGGDLALQGHSGT